MGVCHGELKYRLRAGSYNALSGSGESKLKLILRVSWEAINGE